MKINEIRTHDINTDIMRLIASFFVVMIHIPSKNSAVGLMFNSISRFSVPVFVMISGYYILKKDMEISAVLKKALSIFGFMVVWAAIYYVYELICDTQQFSVGGCLKYLLTEPVHLWYLYALITLYLFTPLLSLVYRCASQHVYQYVLGLTFIFGSCFAILLRIECFSILNTILEKMKFPYTLGFIFLYLLGGYIQKYSINHRKIVYCLGIAASLLNALAAAFVMDYEIVSNVLFSFFFTGNIMAAFAFFLSLNSASFSYGRRVAGVIKKCAGATMGIYVIHPLIINIFASNDFVAVLFAGNDLLIPVRALFVYSIALICTLLIKCVPVLKRLV